MSERLISSSELTLVDKITRFRSHEDVAMRLACDPKQPDWIRKTQQGVADRMADRALECELELAAIKKARGE